MVPGRLLRTLGYQSPVRRGPGGVAVAAGIRLLPLRNHDAQSISCRRAHLPAYVPWRVQTSLTCGILFENSKLPLTTWFKGIYLVTQNKNNLSALSLKRHLSNYYRTACRLKHKVLEAMAERDSPSLLTGAVVADETLTSAVVGVKNRRGG